MHIGFLPNDLIEMTEKTLHNMSLHLKMVKMFKLCSETTRPWPAVPLEFLTFEIIFMVNKSIDHGKLLLIC